LKTALPIIGGVLTFLAIAVCCHPAHGQSTTPFDASRVDFSAITEADIIKTEAHKMALETELLLRTAATAQNLSQAIANTKAAQGALSTYEARVDRLALENASNFSARINAEKTVAEKNAALLRRDGIIAALGIAIAGYLFCKFYLHLPI